MELVFTKPALHSFVDFLRGCRINLSNFVPLGSSVHANMAYIVRGLQPALALCPISGIPRTMSEISLGAASPLSPGLILHNQREAAALALAQEEEAARLASERLADEAATRKKESDAAAAAARIARLKPPKAETTAVAAANSRRPRNQLADEEPQGRRPSKLAAAPPTERFSRLTNTVRGLADWVSDRFSSNPANPPRDPDNPAGGTVKRRFRVQKRQKQTMRPCNIRRQRRTHAVCRRRRRNKNKTH